MSVWLEDCPVSVTHRQQDPRQHDIYVSLLLNHLRAAIQLTAWAFAVLQL